MKEKQPRESVVGLLLEKMNIFVYGTLMDRDIMNHASGADPIGEQACLSDFGRYRVKNAEYPGIRQEQGKRVAGLLYLDVGSEAVRRLDVFEGDMYSRMDVEVQLPGKKKACEAMTYVVKEEYLHNLSSENWDFEEFLEKGKNLFTSGYHGFDDLDDEMKLTGYPGEEKS